MTNPVHCSSCQAVIAPANIDTQREHPTCGQCGRLMDLRQARGSSGGQREGFGGVVLTSSGHPEHVVRVIRDPVRGDLVVGVSPGQPHHVLDGKACKSFVVNVNRTNTNINEIWAVDGNLAIECGELTGSVKFETCP